MEASKRTGERSGDALKDSLLLFFFIIFLIFEVFLSHDSQDGLLYFIKVIFHSVTRLALETRENH